MIALLLIGLVLTLQFTPSYTSEVCWITLSHSRVGGVLQPYERMFKVWSTRAIELEVEDFKRTIIDYYLMARDSILRNRLEDASVELAVMMTLMLKAKGVDEDMALRILDIVRRMDWGRVRLSDSPVGELIDEWLDYTPKSLEDLAYKYASVCLSILDRMPVDSFVRVLFTPILREMYIAGLVAIVVTCSYFVVKRVKVEAGGVRYEGYR